MTLLRLQKIERLVRRRVRHPDVLISKVCSTTPSPMIETPPVTNETIQLPIPGPIGARGVPGVIGPQGTQGTKGDKGDKGDSGVKGDSGSQGIQGPPGLIGPSGTRGKNGSDGKDGKEGLTGKKGDTGKQGATGATGKHGAQGKAGKAGRPSTPGKQGKTGAQGAPGPQGAMGLTPSISIEADRTRFRFIMDGEPSEWIDIPRRRGGGGGVSTPTRIRTSGPTYQINHRVDVIFVDASESDVIIYLPPASDKGYVRFTVVREDSTDNTVTLIPMEGDNVMDDDCAVLPRKTGLDVYSNGIKSWRYS